MQLVNFSELFIYDIFLLTLTIDQSMIFVYDKLHMI